MGGPSGLVNAGGCGASVPRARMPAGMEPLPFPIHRRYEAALELVHRAYAVALELPTTAEGKDRRRLVGRLGLAVERAAVDPSVTDAEVRRLEAELVAVAGPAVATA